MKIKKSFAIAMSMLITALSVPVHGMLTYASSETDTPILEEQLDMPIVSITSQNSITTKEYM